MEEGKGAICTPQSSWTYLFLYDFWKITKESVSFSFFSSLRSSHPFIGLCNFLDIDKFYLFSYSFSSSSFLISINKKFICVTLLGCVSRKNIGLCLAKKVVMDSWNSCRKGKIFKKAKDCKFILKLFALFYIVQKLLSVGLCEQKNMNIRGKLFFNTFHCDRCIFPL